MFVLFLYHKANVCLIALLQNVTLLSLFYAWVAKHFTSMNVPIHNNESPNSVATCTHEDCLLCVAISQEYTPDMAECPCTVV